MNNIKHRPKLYHLCNKEIADVGLRQQQQRARTYVRAHARTHTHIHTRAHAQRESERERGTEIETEMERQGKTDREIFQK